MVRNALKSFFGILVVLIFAAGVFAQDKTEAKPAAKQDAQEEKKNSSRLKLTAKRTGPRIIILNVSMLLMSVKDFRQRTLREFTLSM